jgi:hypothetical protein
VSILKQENWDSVVAPGVPSGWNNDANLKTSSAVFSSSPNSLALSSGASSGVPAYCTWGTADGAGGNVVVQALVQYGNSTANWWGVCARGSATQLNNTTTSQYVGWLADHPSGLSPKARARISVVQAGTETVLGTTDDTSIGLSLNAWYLVQLTCNGTSLQLAIQRQSDGYWLSSGSLWVPGATPAVTVLDSTLSGSGYAAVAAKQGAASQGLYTDNFELDSITAPTWPRIDQYITPYRPPNTQFWN